MSALPIDIARYTTDGVVVTSPTNPATSTTIRDQAPDARDGGEDIRESFYDNAVDAQAMQDERFTYISAIDPLHVGVEVEDSLGLGSTVPIAPTVPTYRALDESMEINGLGRVRSYAQDMGTDRFSVELLG